MTNDISSRSHRFTLGSVVRLVAGSRCRSVESDLYRIVRLLSAEGQEYRYRIRDERTGAVYVVLESVLKCSRSAT